MTWTRKQWEWLWEHDWFVPQDIWRIFYSKSLVDSFHQQWQIYCLTGATVKHYDELIVYLNYVLLHAQYYHYKWPVLKKPISLLPPQNCSKFFLNYDKIYLLANKLGTISAFFIGKIILFWKVEAFEHRPATRWWETGRVLNCNPTLLDGFRRTFAKAFAI